jgi:hypothetical protein
MLPKGTPDPETRATALVESIAERNGFSADEVAPIIQAVALDLQAGADRAVADGERIAKLEVQTRVLAAAVVAITETSDALAPAVKAVKDEM